MANSMSKPYVNAAVLCKRPLVKGNLLSIKKANFRKRWCKICFIVISGFYTSYNFLVILV